MADKSFFGTDILIMSCFAYSFFCHLDINKFISWLRIGIGIEHKFIPPTDFSTIYAAILHKNNKMGVNYCDRYWCPSKVLNIFMHRLPRLPAFVHRLCPGHCTDLSRCRLGSYRTLRELFYHQVPCISCNKLGGYAHWHRHENLIKFMGLFEFIL
jgi:hypothetical protein